MSETPPTSAPIKQAQLVSIVVPAWREIVAGENNLATLLDSITAAQNEFAHEVVVVCNGQADSVTEVVRSHPAVTRYCLNSVNVGVSRAWNIGAHMADGNILCFVNEDVILGKRTIGILADTLAALPDVGIIGVEGANVRIVDGEVITDQRIQSGAPQYIDTVSGFLFLVKTPLFHQIGGFDIALTPCSYEEIDFAFRLRAIGFKSYIVPELDYRHPWGISRSHGDAIIEFMGHRETIRNINDRNLMTVVSKSEKGMYGRARTLNPQEDDSASNGGFFTGYQPSITQPRVLRGRWEQPLVKTLADMVDVIAQRVPCHVTRILEIGCAHGYSVQELVNRSYDAYGLDSSEAYINNSPIKERLRLGDARDLPVEPRYDLILSTNFFEHLSDRDAMGVAERAAKISNVFFAIISKRSREVSHINLKPNWQWIALFEQCGLIYDYGLTSAVRQKYREKSAGAERWDRDTLVFVAAGAGLKPSVNAHVGYVIEYLLGTLWVAHRLGFLGRVLARKSLRMIVKLARLE